MSDKASVLAKIATAKTVVQSIAPSAPPPSLPPSDFDTRKTAPGVVRWFDFDSAAQIAGGFDENYIANPSNDGLRRPVIDTSIKCSGAGSLRFDLPSNTTANAGGEWLANFSPDLATRFGENSEFYVQVRVRWNDVMAQTLFQQIGGAPQGGIKFFDVVAGDVFGGVNPDSWGITKYYSSSDLKVVVQSYIQHRYPIVYRYFDGATANLFEDVATPLDVKHQNAMPSPFCLYSKLAALAPGADNPGCWTMLANEWITFQLGIQLGAKGTVIGAGGSVIPVWLNSTVRLWAAREGQPSQLLVDWKPGVPGYAPLWRGADSEDQRFGKVYLFPYMSNKDPAQAHGLGQVWYDDLIISKVRIADPSGSATPAPAPTPTLANLPANTALDLGRYTCAQPADNPAGCERISEYSGFAYDPYNGRMLQFGGGHASTTRTDIGVFDCTSLKWGSLYPSTPCAQQVLANADLSAMRWISSNHPIARHTYDMLVVGESSGGRSFFVMTSGGLNGVEGCGSGGILGGAGASQPRIARFDFASGAWVYSKLAIPWYYASAAAFDPLTKKIVVVGYTDNIAPGRVWLYDPATDTITAGGAAPSNIGYANNLIYFPPTQKFYLISNGTVAGGLAVFEVTLDRTNLAASSIAQVGGMSGSLPALIETGFAYDSKNKVIGGCVRNGLFYAYDPAAKLWTSRVMQTSPVGGAIGTVAHHSLDYDPVNNVFIILTDYASGFRTWAYRYQ